MEADVNGYAEGIALDQQGYISEGSGENIFVVRDGKILTPPLGASVLPGITRDAIMKLAQSLDIPVVETIIPRELLYIADEVFFTGTAAEITPIRSVDRVKVGEGRRGPITEKTPEGIFRYRQRNLRGPFRLADTSEVSGVRGSPEVNDPTGARPTVTSPEIYRFARPSKGSSVFVTGPESAVQNNQTASPAFSTVIIGLIP